MAPKDENEKDRFAVSRRDFFKTAGVGGLAAGITTLAEEVQAQTGPREAGPGEVPVTLMVNGKRVDLHIEPRVTLLDAIRTRAAMTGNKRVCDRGACGACTMIVDGRTLYSCSTLAIDVQGKAIRTVDGLAQGHTLHPVQEAFYQADALMCGFCTPGFVMASVALHEKHAAVTREIAERELNGNICRCGTFTRIMEANLKVKGVTRA